MAHLHCNFHIDCPGSDSPFANFSSETPDVPVFTARCVGFCGFYPDVYFADKCELQCISFVSQEDAELCAARITCLPVDNPSAPGCPPTCPTGCPPTCPPPPPKIAPVLFFNSVQTPTQNCADGTFTWIVPAGQFSGRTQAEANTKAFTWGLEKAGDNIMCLDYIQTESCSEITYESFIGAGGTVVEPLSWLLESGELPNGISLFDSGLPGDTTFVVLSGIPDTPGTFTFTIRCTDANGNFARKTYTIKIADISNSSPLTGGTTGEAYSVILLAAGPVTPPLSWQVSAGALPDGLSLDEQTGEISGTPTVVGTFNFTIKLQDQAT